MPKLFTGAEIVFKSLEDQKVEHIFGDSDYNEVTIHYKNSKKKMEKLSLKKKSEISEEIVDRIVAQFN